MKKRECSTSTSAAMDDLKKFMESQLEEFKVETEDMLAQMKEDLKKLAARHSAKPTRKKAEAMQKTGQAQRQKSPQSEPQHEEYRSDSTSRNYILPLDYVIAGSAIDAVSNDLEINGEAEQERNELISSNNEGENEEEIEDAGLEDSLTLDGPRKSRRTVKEPAWMKDFMTVEDAGLEDFLTSDGPRKSRRTVEEPAWTEDFMTVEDAELEDLSTVDGPRKSRRTIKEPAWMKDFENGKAT